MASLLKGGCHPETDDATTPSVSNTMETSQSYFARPDEIARRLSALPSPLGYESQTMNLDKSQPPTPDGTDRPTNFQTIAPGIYRSSYPHFAHYDRLEDLGLKTIITLVGEDIPLSYGNFLSTHGIIHHQIPILANKIADVSTPSETIHQVLEVMLDPCNYPMLIHCNKGKHRTGCITACFRKVCGWTDEAAIAEYVSYATPKDRELDKEFIKNFDPSALKPLALDRGYVGGVYKQPIGDSALSERSSVTIYTNNSVATYGTEESEQLLHEYQERVRKENNDLMESSRLWHHR